MLNVKTVPGFDRLMSYVERINLLNGGTACALFVIQNDCVVAEYYAGKHSHEESSRPTTSESQFNIASVRKSYRALQHRGRSTATLPRHGCLWQIKEADSPQSLIGNHVPERSLLKSLVFAGRSFLSYQSLTLSSFVWLTESGIMRMKKRPISITLENLVTWLYIQQEKQPSQVTEERGTLVQFHRLPRDPAGC